MIDIELELLRKIVNEIRPKKTMVPSSKRRVEV